MFINNNTRLLSDINDNNGISGTALILFNMPLKIL